jgi:hypothetical protein
METSIANNSENCNKRKYPWIEIIKGVAKKTILIYKAEEREEERIQHIVSELFNYKHHKQKNDHYAFANKKIDFGYGDVEINKGNQKHIPQQFCFPKDVV